MTTKIYDCSNSTLRPPNRGFGGPLSNDIVRYLKIYAKTFGCSFVKSVNESDVVFTNDVFTQEAIRSGKPLIKRMDGVFSRTDLIPRNTLLNNAAEQANHVIFISNYSKNSFLAFYPDCQLKSLSVTLNMADPSEFTPTKQQSQNIWISSATDWSRPEKRINAILNFSRIIPKSHKILVIGNYNITQPNDKIEFIGYAKKPQDINTIYQEGSYFFNPSYKDPAPKTVCQAIACNLPTLYANSGGTPEIVDNCGIGITEQDVFRVEDTVPSLDTDLMAIAYKRFISNETQQKIKEEFQNKNQTNDFNNMLFEYFNILKQY